MTARELTYFATVGLTLLFVGAFDVCGALVVTGHSGAAANVLWLVFFYPPVTLVVIIGLAVAIVVVMATES